MFSSHEYDYKMRVASVSTHRPRRLAFYNRIHGLTTFISDSRALLHRVSGRKPPLVGKMPHVSAWSEGLSKCDRMKGACVVLLLHPETRVALRARRRGSV